MTWALSECCPLRRVLMQQSVACWTGACVLSGMQKQHYCYTVEHCMCVCYCKSLSVCVLLYFCISEGHLYM